MHFHTAYSLLDGACAIDKTMKRARELNMPAVAITDHGVLYGIVEFYKKAKSTGIKPILGCEVYVAKGSMYEKQKNRSNHLVLLAETYEGYTNLMQLVSYAHLDGVYYKPRVDKDLMRKYSKGLIALSSCLKGEVTELCAEGRLEEAEKTALEFSDIFGKHNFFLEIQDHGIKEQRIALNGVVDIASRTGLPLVATNDVHYLKREHARAHEVMLCLQTGTVMSDPKRMQYSSDEFYMKSADEMWELFGDYPEALENTANIAERCNVELPLGTELHFPTFDLEPGMTQKHKLRELAVDGLKRLYDMKDPDNPDQRETKILERLDYELGIIEKTGFINYFLVVWDFIRYAHEQDIPVGPGRGSGAGSLVAYALGITGIDPLKYNLIFERFLNPERVSPPDFDIDFCKRRRDEVIEYVRDKYGADSVAQIITFGSMGAKTVIRDIGRVLELPFTDCDQIAKMIPDDPGMTLEKALKQSPDFLKATKENEVCKQIMEHAPVLEGLFRNPGTHAAGVVIGEKPLIELLPLSRDKNGDVVTQFEMKSIDDVGLLKMDFLGLRTLTIIHDAVINIRETTGEDLDIDAIPMDDQPTFDLLNRADSIGIFQLESDGMRNLLRQIGLVKFEEIIAMIALFRPGPMNMLDDYVKRKHGKIAIQYDHPLLEPILEETYGVMLYQEQVQQAANVLAGYSLGQGDMLRRAMGKKKPEEMAKQKEKFIEGCQKINKIPRAKAESIFKNIEAFAGYGFNKSHSTAYAILSYQTAWLKAHYPVQFMAATLTSEMGNTDKLPTFITEAREMGIDILPPSVNDSWVQFKPEGHAIRFGLAGIKNVGENAVMELVGERNTNGPFKDLVDFCMRVDSRIVNKRQIENLVRSGAFDFTDMSRGRLFNGIEFAIRRAATAAADKVSGQTSLFDMMAPEESKEINDDLPPADPWPTSEMLSHEKELLGYYISGHPLQAHEWTIETLATTRIADIENIPIDTSIRLGGLVAQFARKALKKRDNEYMGVFRLEGLDGAVDVVAFPRTFTEYGRVLQEEAPVMVCGKLGRRNDLLQVTADEIYELSKAPDLFIKHISIHFSSATLKDTAVTSVQEILRQHPGNTEVRICLQFPDGSKIFMNTSRNYRVTPSQELIYALEHVIGEGCIYVESESSACLHEHVPDFRRRKKAGSWS